MTNLKVGATAALIAASTLSNNLYSQSSRRGYIQPGNGSTTTPVVASKIIGVHPLIPVQQGYECSLNNRSVGNFDSEMKYTIYSFEEFSDDVQRRIARYPSDNNGDGRILEQIARNKSVKLNPYNNAEGSIAQLVDNCLNNGSPLNSNGCNPSTGYKGVLTPLEIQVIMDEAQKIGLNEFTVYVQSYHPAGSRYVRRTDGSTYLVNYTAESIPYALEFRPGQYVSDNRNAPVNDNHQKKAPVKQTPQTKGKESITITGNRNKVIIITGDNNDGDNIISEGKKNIIKGPIKNKTQGNDSTYTSNPSQQQTSPQQDYQRLNLILGAGAQYSPQFGKFTPEAYIGFNIADKVSLGALGGYGKFDKNSTESFPNMQGNGGTDITRNMQYKAFQIGPQIGFDISKMVSICLGAQYNGISIDTTGTVRQTVSDDAGNSREKTINLKPASSKYNYWTINPELDIGTRNLKFYVGGKFPVIADHGQSPCVNVGLKYNFR